ncbi:MAG TPA: LysM peptidoglycan-binding domain-containing protein [Chthoniobacterales bacterium]
MRLKLNAMLSGAARSLLFLVPSGIFAISVSAQTMPGKPAALKRIEPGLEDAVKWEWHVAPSDDKDWGLQSPDATPTPTPPVTALSQPENRPAVYEVKRGDALILIGKKFGMTVPQIKAFNGLKDDMIRVGQMLKIPTLAELKTMTPPPETKHKPAKTPVPGAETGNEFDKLRLQIFLDREQFSAGPIVGEPGSNFRKIILLYESTHEDAKDDASLGAKAKSVVGDVFTHYKLKAEDFRFIAQPRAETVDAKPTASPHAHSGKLKSRSPPVTALPLTYNQLTAMSMLAYRNPWEFVAERFHCQESYLRTLNDKLPARPGIGTEFRVPNVIPFEIEKAFDEPLQPQADPKNPVTAAVFGLSQLNIYQGGALVAVLPMSPARPGLHGRNSWTILDVIPRPRLATFQKERKEQTQKVATSYASTSPEPSASPSKIQLPSEQYLAAGPRNPAGILWINLAKSNSSEPLPYGLHGTSIPDQMNIEESIGGFRLTNWDIARAVRHLPFGTPLEWK